MIENEYSGNADLTDRYIEVDVCPVGKIFAEYKIRVIAEPYKQSIRIDVIVTGEYNIFSCVGDDLVDIDISTNESDQIVLRMKMKTGDGFMYFTRTAE